MKDTQGVEPRFQRYQNLFDLSLMLHFVETKFMSARLSKAGLHLINYPMLVTLESQAAGMSMSDLAKMFDLPPASATALVDKLAQQDFVHRYNDTVDRRVVKIMLTEKGREYLLDMKRFYVEEHSPKVFSDFDDHELEMVERLMTKLYAWYSQQQKEKI